MVDELRGGRYVTLALLGEGAQGRTFDGVDKREGRPVAIKRFDLRGATSWKSFELAEREVRVLSSLSHPKLPAYVDHFEQDGALYLVMEKIEGESLASLRKRGAKLGEDEVLRLLRDASLALDYLHGRAPPVIHRDLKPGNVLRRPDGSYAFVDFGAVRDKLRPEGGSTVVGTFGYMAPEQFQGRALPASDVYSVGATALALLTGCEPEELPHKGLAIDVREALRGRGGRLVGILERMLDPDPEKRAQRIAPLLVERASSPPRGSSQRARESAHERDARRATRHAQRAAQKEARKAVRRARREARRHGRRERFIPLPFAVISSLAITLSIVAVAVALQVVVPVVLQILAAFVARRTLLEAAESVRQGGDAAVEGMRRSRAWVWGRGGADGDSEVPLVRVEEAPPPNVRVHVGEVEEEEATVSAEEKAKPHARSER